MTFFRLMAFDEDKVDESIFPLSLLLNMPSVTKRLTLPVKVSAEKKRRTGSAERNKIKLPFRKCKTFQGFCQGNTDWSVCIYESHGTIHWIEWITAIESVPETLRVGNKSQSKLTEQMCVNLKIQQSRSSRSLLVLNQKTGRLQSKQYSGSFTRKHL